MHDGSEKVSVLYFENGKSFALQNTGMLTLMPEGQIEYSRGWSPLKMNNTLVSPERAKGIYVAGTFTFLGMHFVFSTKNRVPNKDKFGWQDGYGAFSVSKSAEDTVIQYIRNQQEYHRKKSFQEEFIEFLNKHGIEYDENYIWK